MAVLALLPGVSLGTALTWDGGPGGTGRAWETAANWNPDQVPVAADTLQINSNSSQANPVVIATAPAVATSLTLGYSGQTGYLAISNNLTLSGLFDVGRKGTAGNVGMATQTAGTVSVGSISIQSGGINLGQYNLSGGTLAVGTTFTMGRGDTDCHGKFYQTGGTVTVGTTFQVGFGGATGTGTSLYSMTAGSLTVSGNSVIGYKNTAGNDFIQSGGTASFSTIELGKAHASGGSGAGTITLSDAANFTSGTLTVGINAAPNTGVGTVVLDGSKTGAGTNMTVNGNFLLNTANSTLKGVIDSDAIATATAMRKVEVTGNVTFAAGSLLLPVFDSLATPTAGTWTLMSWTGTLTNNGLAFDSSVDTSKWSFLADATAKTLTVTYIPEPATMALLSVGGALMMLKRRRSA